MNGAAMYSKTRLGTDQAEGALSLTPRAKRIVYLVVALVVALGVGIGVWSAVSHDEYSASANGCVNMTTVGTTGGQLFHVCGAQAKSFCKSAFTKTDRFSLLARTQCDLAGWTAAKVNAG
jgi:hypothetical protein